MPLIFAVSYMFVFVPNTFTILKFSFLIYVIVSIRVL